ESLVGLHRHGDVEVTRHAATRRDLALAGEAQGSTVVDAGRNVDVDLGALLLHPNASAVLARLDDDDAGAAALRTRGLDHEEPLRDGHLALTAAVAAGLGLGPRLGTG